ncbi:MAG: hypothetical protein ACPHL6_10235, partial [Rubripirellula sp.]
DNWRDPTDYQRVLMAHRIVQAGILISLLWKWEFFIYANNVYHSIKVVDVFFPAALRSAFVLKVTFLGTVGAGSLSLLATSFSIRRAGNLISLAGLCVLCTHQGSYNDVTFFTTWWCTVWTWWLGNRIDHDEPAELLTKAAFLARAIISMIMLGGAVGKWTEEYWSGQVLFDIYFADRDYWIFNYLRDQYTSEQLQMIAKWYSRNVVVVESLAGLFYWLLPNRLAATVGAILLLSIALSSNLLLFSVLGCLISLAMVGFLPRKLPSTSQTDS